MKIGFLGKQSSFALEMLRRLQCEHPEDKFSAWQPGDKTPSTELEVIFASGKVDRKEIEAQTKLGLLQMSSAGSDGVDVDAATKARVWVAASPTTQPEREDVRLPHLIGGGPFKETRTGDIALFGWFGGRHQLRLMQSLAHGLRACR